MQRRIRIDRTGEQCTQIVVRLRPRVQPGQESARRLVFEPVEWRSDRQRQHQSVSLSAEQIAQCRRPDERQEYIGPRLHTVEGQRIAEPVGSVW
ncbi:hypothetical protein ASF09_05165 [Sphingomonas sp. Leaf242]|nr:hypothetical protein ASF09_05165 [Sphingomonas sp. Leaf242]